MYAMDKYLFDRFLKYFNIKKYISVDENPARETGIRK